MYREGVAVHYVPHIAKVFHCSVPKEVCEQTLSAFNELEKPDFTGQFNNNLLETLRTDWHCDNNPVMQPVVQCLMNKFIKCFKTLDCPDDLNITIKLVSSWIAESKKDAEIEPHMHGEMSNGWSFCLYARIPEGKTSLTFFDPKMSKTRVTVQEGDLLVFPSNLGHYSSDTHPGRTVYAGNLSVVWDEKF